MVYHGRVFATSWPDYATGLRAELVIRFPCICSAQSVHVSSQTIFSKWVVWAIMWLSSSIPWCLENKGTYTTLGITPSAWQWHKHNIMVLPIPMTNIFAHTVLLQLFACLCKGVTGMFIPLVSIDTNIWPQASVKKLTMFFVFVRSGKLIQISCISLTSLLKISVLPCFAILKHVWEYGYLCFECWIIITLGTQRHFKHPCPHIMNELCGMACQPVMGPLTALSLGQRDG